MNDSINDFTFNYSDQAPSGSQIEPQQPVIESASASTACQTNNSKFAYILTGGVLGVLALLAIAITLLAYAVIDTSLRSYEYGYYDDTYDDWDDSWDEDWEDDFDAELEEFERRLWSEHPTHNVNLPA